MVTFVRLLHLRNAAAPIEVTEFPIVTLVRRSQLRNAAAPIEVTVGGATIFVLNVEQFVKL